MSVQLFPGVTVAGRYIVDNADLFRSPSVDPIELIVQKAADRVSRSGVAHPFVDDDKAYFVALEYVRQGNPVDKVVAALSRLAEIKKHINYGGYKASDPDMIETRVVGQEFSWDGFGQTGASLVERVRIVKSGRDRHQGERSIVYGGKESVVTYGVRNGGYGEKIVGIRTSRVPSDRMVRKAVELVEAVNKRNWKQASERFYDLVHMDGHLFHTSQTYTQFLTDVGSIILQQSEQHVVELLGVTKYHFPTSYSINKPQQIFPKPETDRKEHRPSSDGTYVDRRHIMRRVVIADPPVTAVSQSTPIIEYRRPHQKLEVALSKRRF